MGSNHFVPACGLRSRLQRPMDRSVHLGAHVESLRRTNTVVRPRTERVGGSDWAKRDPSGVVQIILVGNMVPLACAVGPGRERGVPAAIQESGRRVPDKLDAIAV